MLLIVAFLFSFPTNTSAEDKPDPFTEGLDRLIKEMQDNPERELEIAEKMITFFDAELEKFPGRYDVQFGRARILLLLNREKEAEAAFQASIKIKPKQVEPQMALAKIYIHQGRDFDASRFLKSVIQIQPKNAPARQQLGLILWRNNRRSHALPHFEVAARESPHKPSYLWSLAECQHFLGDYKNALENFLTHANELPDHWQTHEKIIQITEALGRKELRDEWLEKIIALEDVGKVPDLTKRGYFVRDRFEKSNLQIEVRDVFEMKGPNAVKYSFWTTPPNRTGGPPKGPEKRFILGSFESENSSPEGIRMLLRSKKPRYHLDEYSGLKRFTYAYFAGNPGYDKVKEVLMKILDEKLKPLQSVPSVKKE